MHIAYVCADPGVPVFGRKGCSVHVQEVVRALQRRGDRVTLLAARFGSDRPADLETMQVRPLPRLPSQEDPGFSEAVAALARCTEQELQALTGIDLIYERHSLWSHRAMELGSRWAVPTCLEVNAPLIEEQQRYRALLHPDLARSCVEWAYTAADTILAVSHPVAASIRARVPSHSNVQIVHNGVDVARFAPQQKQRLPRDHEGLIFGFCGSLKPWHGVLDLIEAFALHHRHEPRSRLLIIGDGPERAAVSQRIRERQLESQVEMTGSLAPQEIPAQLARLDVGVAPYPALPDLYFSPLKLFEYLAAGACVVAPDLGDIPALIQHGQSGLLYPAGDLQALSAVFNRLSAEPALARQLGENGRQQAWQSHSWDQVVAISLDYATGTQAWRGDDA